MKQRHYRHRIEQAKTLSLMSHCPRGQVGCVFINETENIVLSDGYNGTEPDDSNQCGTTDCLRTRLKIKSGTMTEIGCGHAETSAINRAARLGISLNQSTAIVTCEPCLNCAKSLIRVGIKRLIYTANVYAGVNGLEYLAAHGVDLVLSTSFDRPIIV